MRCRGVRQGLNARRNARRALTIVEAVIASGVVGVMLVAALGTVGATKTTEYRAADRLRAAMLAQSLMSEIVQQPYKDPGLLPLFGHELGESTTTRADCNDVDDYNGWNVSPPQYKDGTVIPNMVNWRTTVTVDWVSPADLNQVRILESGVKKITVKVSHNGATLATLVCVRTSAR
jgi:type II secretory pathway pseudopilin PulG